MTVTSDVITMPTTCPSLGSPELGGGDDESVDTSKKHDMDKISTSKAKDKQSISVTLCV